MRDPVELRRRAGVTGDPDRDQHFLDDERVLDRIVSYAVDGGFDLDHVLEIGPGAGALTARLLAVADCVTAIESDRTLVDFLEREFAESVASGRLRVETGDATSIAFPDFTASVSNLPYGVSSPVLFRLLPRWRPLVLLVQQEFGERMAAAPGTDAYGRLSVTAQHYATIELLETVPPGVFTPPPAVDSAIVRTTPRQPTYAIPDEEAFFRVIRAIFTQRRKTVRNAIRNTTHISAIEDPDAVIEALGQEVAGDRPANLPPETFAKIATLAAEADR